ncbi:MAG: IS5/IS1182 family transposase, partial [Truepera sp.]|nr:IS5/IS1182 family transposase [Truepera sp.]
VLLLLVQTGTGRRLRGHLKVFRILSGRYRNRRKRLALRFSLIAGIFNFELALS